MIRIERVEKISPKKNKNIEGNKPSAFKEMLRKEAEKQGLVEEAKRRYGI